MRLVSLTKIDYSDITYNITDALIFGALEPSVGVTLACLPLLRPLLGRSKYSDNGTVQLKDSSESPSNGVIRSRQSAQKNGFTPLEYDSA